MFFPNILKKIDPEQGSFVTEQQNGKVSALVMTSTITEILLGFDQPNAHFLAQGPVDTVSA